MKCVICGKTAYYGIEYKKPLHCKSCKTNDEENVSFKRCFRCKTRINKSKTMCSKCFKIKIHAEDSSDDIESKNDQHEVRHLENDQHESEIYNLSHISSPDDLLQIDDYEDTISQTSIPEIIEIMSQLDDLTESSDVSSDAISSGSETENDDWKTTKTQLKNSLIDETGYLQTIKSLETENQQLKIDHNQYKIHNTVPRDLEIVRLEQTIKRLKNKLVGEEKLEQTVQQLKNKLNDEEEKNHTIKKEYDNKCIKMIDTWKSEISNKSAIWKSEISKMNKNYKLKIEELKQSENHGQMINKELIEYRNDMHELELSYAETKAQRNTLIKKVIDIKRQLKEEQEFIYLEWVLSVPSGVCRLVEMNVSIDNNFTRSIITKLKDDFFRRSKNYGEIVRFLEQFRFEVIKSTSIPINRNSKCDCINKGPPLKWEIYRTYTL